MIRIAAGVVLFNPQEIARVQMGLRHIAEQVETLYIYDNSTVPTPLDMPSDVVVISNHRNLGIAHALNAIMHRADQDGFDWVVTLDQDSVVPKGLVEAFSDEINSSQENIGIICPQVIDKRRIYNSQPVQSPDREYVSKAITSASCTSIKAWKMIGQFDEWMFIDLVDNEFCKRMTTSGFKILRLNRWVLDQEFGTITPKPISQQRFWLELSKITHIKNLAKFSYSKQVNSLRVYYVHRNIIYANRKLRHYGQVGYNSFNCRGYLGFIINYSLPSILRAQHKRRVLHSIVKGTLDGLKAPVEVWSAPELELRGVAE
ncbi:glycosyltransferase [Bifidobacterium eulemuris]|uniref:Glycosyl transferase family 2 n=1 Tax=Bifidobacterium eulemuris TaxID=1765219 RepID=A0A261G563_9BIFI|nr:glycosyltransferase [Bifidobacterium eulemuris]OZG66571.1 glycosyl transferase family 2 [Bifidobacterium eulemuris]QOL32654.1 glycosyltransferase [Bifidobacterium eulemuris]